MSNLPSLPDELFLEIVNKMNYASLSNFAVIYPQLRELAEQKLKYLTDMALLIVAFIISGYVVTGKNKEGKEIFIRGYTRQYNGVMVDMLADYEETRFFDPEIFSKSFERLGDHPSLEYNEFVNLIPLVLDQKETHFQGEVKILMYGDGGPNSMANFELIRLSQMRIYQHVEKYNLDQFLKALIEIIDTRGYSFKMENMQKTDKTSLLYSLSKEVFNLDFS